MKKFPGIINIIILFLALFCTANYIFYLVHLIIFPEQPLAFIITFSVLGITVLPLVFRKKLKKICGKFYPVLKGIYALGLAFYFVSFSALSIYIMNFSANEVSTENLPEKTVFIVYGAKVNGSADNPRPGNALRFRLNRAAQLLDSCPESVCIVSGGKGSNEPVAEAEVMKDYLISKGIKEDRIITEAKSKNTIDNIVFSSDIINEKLNDYAVCSVSTNFHMPRIKYLCDKYGLSVLSYYGAPSPNFASLYSSLVREYMSYGKLILTGRL